MGVGHGKCREWLGSLSDYVDGTLEETLCVEIERHMQNCDNCRVVNDTLRKTISLYQSTASTSMPEEVRERLYRRLQLDEFLNL